MQSCSKQFTGKASKPNMSSSPHVAAYAAQAVAAFVSVTTHRNARAYSSLARASRVDTASSLLRSIMVVSWRTVTVLASNAFLSASDDTPSRGAASK